MSILRSRRGTRRLRLALTLVASVALGASSEARAWGGVFTAASGELVRIDFSDHYPEDASLGQRWADYLAGLLHGGELASLNLNLVTRAEVRRLCGAEAVACYSPVVRRIVAPAEATAGLSAEAIVAHEYGHHVAQNRDNAPWPAVDWGTKRWASYLNVCAKARTGTLFPGDQYTRYELNPGEGFAEAYRVLNERRLGSPESPWRIVDRIMYPDDKALELLAQDVREPWSAPTRISFSGSYRKGSGELRSFRVSTPLDGELELGLRGPAKAAYRLSVLSGDRVVAGAPVGRTSLSVTVCGQRTLSLRVERRRGFGTFQLTASKP